MSTQSGWLIKTSISQAFFTVLQKKGSIFYTLLAHGVAAPLMLMLIMPVLCEAEHGYKGFQMSKNCATSAATSTTGAKFER